MAEGSGEIIELDPALKDRDSSYESSTQESSTQSLTSSIHEYIFENGRHFHSYYGPDRNLHPIDETEQDRLDLVHEIYRLLFEEKLFKAPLKDPKRILDLGTGTGIWAVDMADKFPEAQVIGVDLSPIQPGYVPPNCSFVVDDIELDWTYPANHFDFIHARDIAQGISNWPKLISEITRCLKPNGYVELIELGCFPYSDDNTIAPDNGCKKILELLGEAMRKINRPLPDHGTLKNKLEAAGYEDVVETWHKLPQGPWPKDQRLKVIGGMVWLSAQTGFEAYTMMPLTKILGYSNEEAQKIVQDALDGLKDENMHSWAKVFVAYGRKPTVKKANA